MKLANDTTSEILKVFKYVSVGLFALCMLIAIGVVMHMFGSYVMAMVVDMTTTKSPDDVQNTANGFGVAIGVLSMAASILGLIAAGGAFEEG